MVGVVVVLSARTGDVADGHADVLLELLGKELVSSPEGIEGIDEVVERDIRTQLLQGAAYGLAGDGLPEAPHMEDAGGTDTGGDNRMIVLL